MDLPTENTPAVSDPAPNTQPVEKRPGVWSGLGIVALYFLLQFGLGLLFGAMAGFLLMVKAAFQAGLHHRAPPDARAVMQALQASPDTRVIFIVATIVAAAAVMILLVRQFWRAQWSRAELPGFGLTAPANKASYLIAVLLGVAVLLLGGPLTHILAGHHQVDQDVSLLSGLASRMPIGWAMLVGAIVFGCVHLPDFKFAWYPVPALIILGLVSAWLRVRTRSLWPSITLHATNNFIAAIAWFVVASH